MIKLKPFRQSDFDILLSWIDSKELLIQIAGTYFSYPLNVSQLQSYLDDKNSFAFNVIETASNKIIGHSEVIMLDNNVCKLGKILIGDKYSRGKGVGRQIVNELLTVSFGKLKAVKTELYVYDWNTGAIKSYERAGFNVNPEKQMLTEINGTTWKALNMTINKEKWLMEKTMNI
jgi:RimJ/RimL family protein N-acetyltransferase